MNNTKIAVGLGVAFVVALASACSSTSAEEPFQARGERLSTSAASAETERSVGIVSWETYLEGKGSVLYGLDAAGKVRFSQKREVSVAGGATTLLISTDMPARSVTRFANGAAERLVDPKSPELDAILARVQDDLRGTKAAESPRESAYGSCFYCGFDSSNCGSWGSMCSQYKDQFACTRATYWCGQATVDCGCCRTGATGCN